MKLRDFFFRIRIGRMFDPYWQEKTDGVKDIADKHPTNIGGFNGHKSVAPKDSK